MSNIINQSSLSHVVEQINLYANRRASLLLLLNNRSIDTPFDLHHQTSLLATSTQTTNQLTRQTSVCGSFLSIRSLRNTIDLASPLSAMPSLDERSSIDDDVFVSRTDPIHRRWSSSMHDECSHGRFFSSCDDLRPVQLSGTSWTLARTFVSTRSRSDRGATSDRQLSTRQYPLFLDWSK